MNADEDITAETVRAHVRSVGLTVPEEDIEALLTGARRTRAIAEGVRRLVAPEVEPAPVFAPKAARL